MEKPRLSLCMIVKNEAPYLAQAIESVRAAVDEIIVVDTGSSDGSDDLAVRLGAKLSRFTWNNDFSAARNYSLAQASGDWVLVLDADEAIDRRDLDALRSMLVRPDACYLFRQRHYVDATDYRGFHACRGEYAEWEREHLGYYDTWICRLFPRMPELRYEGTIHELVEHSVTRSGRYQLIQAAFPLHHFGYTKDVAARKRKTEFYEGLSTAKLADGADERSCFELGLLLLRKGEHARSIELFRKALYHNPESIGAWFSLGAALQREGRLDEAATAFNEVLQRDPKSADAHGNMGMLFLQRGERFLAEAHLKKALDLNADFIPAYGGLAHLAATGGQPAQAVAILTGACARLPKVHDLRLELAKLHVMCGNAASAKAELERLPATARRGWRAEYLLSKVLLDGRDQKGALEALRRAEAAISQDSATSARQHAALHAEVAALAGSPTAED